VLSDHLSDHRGLRKLAWSDNDEVRAGLGGAGRTSLAVVDSAGDRLPRVWSGEPGRLPHVWDVRSVAGRADARGDGGAQGGDRAVLRLGGVQGRGRTFESCRAHGLTKPFFRARNAEKCAIRPSYSASLRTGEAHDSCAKGARGEGLLGFADRAAGDLGASEDGLLQDGAVAAPADVAPVLRSARAVGGGRPRMPLGRPGWAPAEKFACCAPDRHGEGPERSGSGGRVLSMYKEPRYTPLASAPWTAHPNIASGAIFG
jgi:hypothetical protein